MQSVYACAIQKHFSAFQRASKIDPERSQNRVYKQYPPTSHTKSITGAQYAKDSKMVPKGSPKGTLNEVKINQKIDLLRNIIQRLAKGRLWAVSGYPLGAKNDVFDKMLYAIKTTGDAGTP